MSSNKTFIGGYPTWANACVGNNGNPSYVDYAQGFSASANVLLDELIKDNCQKYSVDSFIYPICFNMRHSVELRLKGCVSTLQALVAIKGESLQFDFESSHDLGNIWSFIKDKFPSFDDRFTKYITNLDTYIQDIAKIDPTGQTFRYAKDNESKKHLTEISIINICILKSRFSALEKVLDELNYFNMFILEEYSLGTFTKSLSRAKIFAIASELPPRKIWGEDSFDIVKAGLIAKYSISSNELSKSIKLIERNYETARIISSPTSLKGINLKDLYVFFNEWLRLHDISLLQKEVTDSFGICYPDKAMFGRMIEYTKLRDQASSNLSATLDPKSLAGLIALHYFGMNIKFSEEYLQIYNIHLKESLVNYEQDKTRFRASLAHLLEKTNAFEYIINSLYFLGHEALAEQILRKYNLHDSLDWVNELRTKSKFLKPKLWNYPI